MLKQFVNGRILTPKGWLDGGSIVTDGNRIRCVSNIDLHVVGAEIIDVNGGYIVPGGIDMADATLSKAARTLSVKLSAHT